MRSRSISATPVSWGAAAGLFDKRWTLEPVSGRPAPEGVVSTTLPGGDRSPSGLKGRASASSAFRPDDDARKRTEEREFRALAGEEEMGLQQGVDLGRIPRRDQSA
jgi:hypothetical protein